MRFRRAKRMARKFQMPRRLDRPSISRIDFRLRVGAMMNWGEGIGEGVCLIEALSSLYTNKRTIPPCHVSEISWETALLKDVWSQAPAPNITVAYSVHLCILPMPRHLCRAEPLLGTIES